MTVCWLGGPSVPARAFASTPPCGNVDFGYFPDRVAPGQTMAMDLQVENCSAAREWLFLEVGWTGPCDFFHPQPRPYKLGAHQGVGLSALFIGPDCPGTYQVRVRLTIGGQILDRDRSGFVISAAT